MRGGASADRVMGLFVNTLPVRIRMGGESVEEGVGKTQESLAELVRHEHASLALVQRCSGVAAPAPLFTALLNYRHIGASAQTEEERHLWEGTRWLRGEERTNYPVVLSVNDFGQTMSLTAQVEASIEPLRLCEFMRRAMESLVEALERDPQEALSALEVVPEPERQQLVYQWNTRAEEYRPEKCVHELFEEQVEKNAEAVALVYGKQELSYGELNRRANRVAHYLRELGVGPDKRVAVCLERSLEMGVGLLAVLKAGGAYVPLDPEFPVERLRFMVEDSGSEVLLTKGAVAGVADGIGDG